MDFKPKQKIKSALFHYGNRLGWSLVLRFPQNKQDMTNCRKLLGRCGRDIARNPILVNKRGLHHRPVEDQKMFQQVYSDSNLTDFSRCFLLFSQVRRIIRNNIPGDFAELGVYTGKTAKLIHLSNAGRALHLFDTFQGQPDNATALRDGDSYIDHVKNKKLANTSIEAVQHFIGQDAAHVFYHMGYFPATAEKLKAIRFAFIHLDGDQYQTTWDGLDFFFPRLVEGGALVCHDYGIYRGVKDAVDTYFAKLKTAIIEYPDAQGSVLVIKT